MTTARHLRTTVSVLAATALVAAGPVLASGPAAAAGKAPVTRFVTVKPWTSKGVLQVKATTRKAPADSLCVASNITGRTDAYRCFIGNEAMDPAFKSPTANSFAVRIGSTWRVYTNVTEVQPGSSGPTQAFQVKLTNGATCYAATGAGPAPLPRFPYWAGLCTGGPYGSDGAIWRATEDDGKNANYPLLALDSKRTKWSVAVEYPEGTVKFEPARTAYR